MAAWKPFSLCSLHRDSGARGSYYPSWKAATPPFPSAMAAPVSIKRRPGVAECDPRLNLRMASRLSNGLRKIRLVPLATNHGGGIRYPSEPNVSLIPHP